MEFARADTISQSLEAFKVGAIYVNLTGVNPASELGYGVWAVFGTGRTLVGFDAGDSDFDAARKVSGSKAHTLTTAQMPSHTHTQDPHAHGVTDPGHAHTQRFNAATTGPLSGPTTAPDTSSNTTTNYGITTATNTTGISVNNATATNQNTGGGQSHPNVQPSITVHFWERTA